MTSLAAARRPGLTLTEVLVAMFVMALGLISLLTLFPLGAVQIGFALRDDRCAQTAIQADTFLRAWWQAKIVEPSNTGNPPAEAAFWAMDDPNLVIQRRPNTSATISTPPTAEATSPAGIRVNQYVQQLLSTTIQTTANTPISTSSLYGDLYLSTTPTPTADSLLGGGSVYYTVPPANPPSTGNVPSYPVFIDPINVRAKNATGDATWVAWTSAGGAIPLLVPRRELAMVTNAGSLATAIATQTCSLLDDLTFDPNGVPHNDGTTAAPLISRQGRYNWSAVVQRPANNNRATATLTILVFDGRPPGLNIPGSEVVVKSSGDISVGTTSITLTIPAPVDPNAPAIVRRGGWFMDGTLSTTPGASRLANFYRIVGLTDNGSNSYTLDIDPPIRARSDGVSNYPATLYFFAGLAEVFVRPPLTPNPAPGQ